MNILWIKAFSMTFESNFTEKNFEKVTLSSFGLFLSHFGPISGNPQTLLDRVKTLIGKGYFHLVNLEETMDLLKKEVDGMTTL